MDGPKDNNNHGDGGPSNKIGLAYLRSLPFSGQAIDWSERDLYLQLGDDDWAAKAEGRLPDENGWKAVEGSLCRTLWTVTKQTRDRVLEGEPDEDGEVDVPLHARTIVRERILRTPSTPIFRFTNPERVTVPQDESQVGPDGQPLPRDITAFHSIRVLDLEEQDGKPADRVFLFTNGLNETKGMELFQRLSGWLLNETKGMGQKAVCIVHPFPGHLTRYAAPSGQTETPLNRYLDDSLELFRHYAKYMVESQWLMSMLVPRDEYACFSGSRLTGTKPRIGRSRSDSLELANQIRGDWTRIQSASRPHELGFDKPKTPTPASFKVSIDAIREAVGRTTTVTGVPTSGTPERPEIHLLGYSLGGFVAQSMFNLWPYAIASCTTLCSGGALRNLSLTSFAHPEEWQTLLHSLRYRLDTELHSDTFRTDRGHIFGVRERFAEDLLRTFYEVFEQESRPTYQTRMSEYFSRFLFVIGGNDPIVQPRSVLDAMPSEGANVVEIAGMSHFISTELASANSEETEQRSFWFPEVASLISRWAVQTEHLRTRSVAAGWRVPIDEQEIPDGSEGSAKTWRWAHTDDELYPEASSGKPINLRRGDQVLVDLRRDHDLALGEFDATLNQLATNAKNTKGFLLVSQNSVPTWMQSSDHWTRRAKSLNHSEENIRSYLNRVADRRDALIAAGKGVVVLAPEAELQATTEGGTNDRRSGLWSADPSSEVILGETLDLWRRSDEAITAAMARGFSKRWAIDRSLAYPAVRGFTPGLLAKTSTVPMGLGFEIDDAQAQAFVKRGRFISNRIDACHVTRLPECWVYLRLPPTVAYEDPIWNANWDADPESTADDLRPYVLTWFITSLANNSKLIKEMLDENSLAVVARSQARNNPRYRGRVVADPDGVQAVLRHLAAGFFLSLPFGYQTTGPDGG